MLTYFDTFLLIIITGCAILDLWLSHFKTKRKRKQVVAKILNFYKTGSDQ